MTLTKIYHFASRLKMYHIVVLLVHHAFLLDGQQLEYRWPKGDRRFDSVVAVTINNSHIALGVLCYSRSPTSKVPVSLILTGMNPLEQKYNVHHRMYDVHEIGGSFDRSNLRKVPCLEFIKAEYIDTRSQAWVRIGFDKKLTTIHDIGQITLSGSTPYWNSKTRVNYEAFVSARMPTGRALKSLRVFGYAYVDIVPVYSVNKSSSFELEVFNIKLDELVDCDEWLPRAWGKFVCVSNVHEVVGVTSGATLFQLNSITACLLGSASFELTKGRESIIVFTEIRPYYDRYHSNYCSPRIN